MDKFFTYILNGWFFYELILTIILWKWNKQNAATALSSRRDSELSNLIYNLSWKRCQKIRQVRLLWSKWIHKSKSENFKIDTINREASMKMMSRSGLIKLMMYRNQLRSRLKPAKNRSIRSTNLKKTSLKENWKYIN